MAVFLGSLGLLLGILVMLAGAITFVRGLPDGVTPRQGQSDPQGNITYLLTQETLGLGVVLLALNVVLRLADRPFFVPGMVILAVPALLRADKVRKKVMSTERHWQGWKRHDTERDG